MIRFAAPELLLLLTLIVWFWREGVRSTPRPVRADETRRRGAVVRCGIAALLIVGMSGPQIASGQAPLFVMFVLDASDSTARFAAEMNRRLQTLISRMRDNDSAGLVVFGAVPVVERSVSAPPTAPSTRSDVPTTSTNIESALRLGRMRLPERGARRLVLLSDGHQTDGDAIREASIAASHGIAVDTVLPSTIASERRVSVTNVSASRVVASGEPFDLTVAVEGPAEGRAELVVYREGVLPLRREIRLDAQGVASVTHTVHEDEAGVYLYRVGVRDLDSNQPATDVTEAEAGAMVAVSGKARVLYVGPLGRDIAALVSPAFAVDAVEAAQLPRSAAALAGYDAVILDDVPPGTFDSAQLLTLTHFVESAGGGLLVLGGPRSLDETLVADAGIGKLLPVDVRPRAGSRAPELALVVAFDKSGSMSDVVGGVAKIEWARQGLARVLDAVPRTDVIGLIAFDSKPTVVAQPEAGHDPHAVRERLRGLDAVGGTAIAPALELARSWFTRPEVASISRRHVLLVSDGKTSPDDAARMQALVDDAPFTLSVISLGDERDRAFMMRLAEATGGRAYFPDRASDLPTIVAREASRVTGGRIVEEPFVPRVAAHPIARGIVGKPLPPLGGYVVSALKPAGVRVVSSHRDDPVLAVWQYGLGRVGVYTGDMHAAWSAPLARSGLMAPLITQTLRWAARSISQDSLYTTFRLVDGDLRILVDMGDAGDDRTRLDGQASVRTPTGRIEQISLGEILPGVYEGKVGASDAGAYLFAVHLGSADGGFAAHVLRGFYRPSTVEHVATSVDRALLTRMADMTGGLVLEGDANPFTDRPRAYRDLRRWLLGAALVAFLLTELSPGTALVRRWRLHRRSALGRSAAA